MELPQAVAAALSSKLEHTDALLVSRDTEVRRAFAAAAPELAAAYGIVLNAVDTAAEAVVCAVAETPGLLVIDAAMPDAELFDLLSALKAEEEAARIPVMLLTDDIAPTGLPPAAGTATDSHGTLLDMLCEQLSRAIPTWEMPAK